jgi:uncharacterized protein (DUF58 family)
LLAWLGFALMAAGLWRIDGVLASLGLAAWCLLALAWWMARMNPAAITATLRGPEKVAAGATFPLLLTLSNHRRMIDAFGIRVDIHLAGQTRLAGRASWVAAGSAADLRWRTALPERAAVESQRLRLVSEFPFGFFEAARMLELPCPLLVLPRAIVPRGLRFSGALMDAPQSSGATAGEAPGEPRGLREWRPGDSARRILWPATLRSLARGAGMVVRETDPPGFCPRRCVVLFHSFGANGGLIRPDRFERAISLTAGTLRQLRATGMPARLIADFDHWQAHHANTSVQVARCIERLARANRAADTEAHDLMAALAGVAGDEGLIVISDMPAAGWRDLLPRSHAAAFLPAIEPAKRRKEVAR